jgi:Flp pilus assembly pilin Flp
MYPGLRRTELASSLLPAAAGGTSCSPAAALSPNSPKGPPPVQFLKRFAADDRGLETVEYAIIAGLIVAGLITVVVAIGTWVKGKFSDLKTDLGA